MPILYSQQVKKDCISYNQKKYFSKRCKKWFNNKTETTTFHYSHTQLRIWFLVLYVTLYTMGRLFYSWNFTRSKCIYYYRFYKFIRSVLKKLSFLSTSTTSIWSSVREIIERDEFHVKAELKGRPCYPEIINSERLPQVEDSNHGKEEAALKHVNSWR